MRQFLRYGWLLFLLLMPGVVSGQMVARQYRAQLSFSSTGLWAVVRVRVHTTAAVREVSFRLAPSLRLGDVAIEGQTYRAETLSPGHYALLMVTTWARGTDHEITFHYGGRLPAPDRVAAGAVVLTPSSGWYPRFEQSAGFTTLVVVRVAGGVQLATRGELAEEDSAGVQRWEDGEPGRSFGLVAGVGLSQVNLNWPGLQVQVSCPTLNEDACARAAAEFGGELWADYRGLSGRFGIPRRSRIVPVVLLPGLAHLEGGPSLYFAPLPVGAGGLVGRLELAASLSRLWWKFEKLAGRDRWLGMGLPLETALDMTLDGHPPAEQKAALEWLQARARRDRGELDRAEPARPEGEPWAEPAISSRAARSALVLHMLRMQIGQQTYGRVVERLHELNAAGRGGLTTAALQDASGELTHRDLGWFWGQWLERPDLPRIHFSWRRVYLPFSGQAVRVQVRQNGDAFGFRALVVIVAGGRRYSQWIEVHNHDTILGIPVQGRIDSVRFDPGFELLRASLEVRPQGLTSGCGGRRRMGKRGHPLVKAELTARQPGCS